MPSFFIGSPVTIAGRKGVRVALDMKLSLLGEDAPSTWVHLTMDGEWKGHATGHFKFERPVYDAMIKNYDGVKTPAPLTYGHPKKGTGSPDAVKSGGYVRKLEARDDGLWAFCEFTETAAKMVRAGETKFSSMVVLFDSIDRKTGKEIGPELIEVALTPTPFIDGQKPIELDRETMSAKKPKKLEATATTELADPVNDTVESPSGEGEAAVARDIVELVTKTLGLDAPAALAFLQERAGDMKAWAGKKDEAESEKKEEPMAAEKVTSPSGVSVGGVVTGTEVAIDDVKGLATARITAMERQVADKEDRILRLEKEIQTFHAEKRINLINDALERGVILATDRDFCVKLGDRSPELLTEFLTTKTPAVPTGTRVSPRAPTATAMTELDANDPDLKTFERGMVAAFGQARGKQLAQEHAMNFKANKAASAAERTGV